MQTFFRRFSIVGGFTLLVLLLIGNAIVTSQRLHVQVGNHVWVIHSREVLAELERTESLLLDAETGQRGYLLTGEPKYLAPYNSAITQIDGHILALSQLTADNPTELANVAQLGNLAHQKLSELNETIVLARSGQANQARTVVLSDRGLLLMDQIRQVVAAMQGEENRLADSRASAYERSVRLTRASIGLATVVGVLGLVILAYFILKERALRDRHTQEIRAREEWFRVTLTSIGDAVIATDRNGTVTFLNSVAEQLIGTTSAQAEGKDIQSIFPILNEVTGKAAENPVKKVMELGRVVGLANHTVIQRADGQQIPIEDSAAPIRDDNQQLIGVVLVFRDVSAERKSQDILRKTEKLAAAARLSATVAHEINNPLEAVVNLIFIARNDPDSPPTVVRQLTVAEQEIERVAHITRQTLGFYRESNAPEPVEINILLDSVLNVYANKLYSAGIEVKRDFGPCPPVRAVAGELRQVFANVLANAIDAAGESGAIAVSTKSVPDGESSMVEVVIADSGTGVAPGDLERIFEPFFTTKKDVGTGLGLWVSREIVERHGGSIRVKPSQGLDGLAGAAFALRLPSDSPVLSDSAAPIAEPAASIAEPARPVPEFDESRQSS
jgi:PAS domain S-box-containing protein